MHFMILPPNSPSSFFFLLFSSVFFYNSAPISNLFSSFYLFSIPFYFRPRERIYICYSLFSSFSHVSSFFPLSLLHCFITLFLLPTSTSFPFLLILNDVNKLISVIVSLLLSLLFLSFSFIFSFLLCSHYQLFP